jgi:hypothetical protein
MRSASSSGSSTSASRVTAFSPRGQEERADDRTASAGPGKEAAHDDAPSEDGELGCRLDEDICGSKTLRKSGSARWQKRDQVEAKSKSQGGASPRVVPVIR